MDTTASSFSTRSNAKRAAEKMIAKGTAPTVDYGIKPSDDGRFEIVWKTALTTAEFSETTEAQANQAGWDHKLEKAEAEGWPNTDPTTDEVETEIATARRGGAIRDLQWRIAPAYRGRPCRSLP